MSNSVLNKFNLIRTIVFGIIISIAYMISGEGTVLASEGNFEKNSKIIKHVETKYINSNSIVLRESANSKSKQVAKLNKNIIFNVTNKKTANGSTWMLGKSGKKTGWIQAKYLNNKKELPKKESKYSAKAVEYGSNYIGTPYRWGGITKVGFDCSGFTQHVYKALGKKIPRTAAQQYNSTPKISKSKAKPGDLVFFSEDGKEITHVAIYAGNDKILHASSSKGVNLGKINDGYWNKRLVGFGTFS